MSTIVQLIQRFYDPEPVSTIKFDDINIENINLKNLREQIGYVS